MKHTSFLFFSLFFTATLIIGPITTYTSWAKTWTKKEVPLKGSKQYDTGGELVTDAKSKGKKSVKKNIDKKAGTAAVTGLTISKAKSGVKEKVKPEKEEE